MPARGTARRTAPPCSPAAPGWWRSVYPPPIPRGRRPRPAWRTDGHSRRRSAPGRPPPRTPRRVSAPGGRCGAAPAMRRCSRRHPPSARPTSAPSPAGSPAPCHPARSARAGAAGPARRWRSTSPCPGRIPTPPSASADRSLRRSGSKARRTPAAAARTPAASPSAPHARRPKSPHGSGGGISRTASAHPPPALPARPGAGCAPGYPPLPPARTAPPARPRSANRSRGRPCRG